MYYVFVLFIGCYRANLQNLQNIPLLHLSEAAVSPVWQRLFTKVRRHIHVSEDEDTDSFVLLQRFCRKCFTRWIYFKLSGKVLAKLCFAELSSHLKSIKNRFNGKRKRLKTETSHERA